MKANKKFIVMGLGGFGYGLARELEDQGCEVVAIDKNEERVEELAEELSYLVCADIGEDGLLEAIGAEGVDGVIVATSADLTAGTLATINAKEAGVEYVLAKARSEQHARVLTKVGADMVVYPEQAMGHSIAKSLASSNFADWVELSPKHSMVQQSIGIVRDHLTCPKIHHDKADIGIFISDLLNSLPDRFHLILSQYSTLISADLAPLLSLVDAGYLLFESKRLLCVRRRCPRYRKA